MKIRKQFFFDRTCNERNKLVVIEKALPDVIRENKNLLKYYNKRYILFSKYDEGIQMDKESWYSVTPEPLAKEIAKVCSCDTIIDGFCGVGGNTIQFAFTCKKVIAIDIDPNKIKMARHNAGIYGVEHKIEFITGDFLEIGPTLKADVVFLSPPWGGPNYKKGKQFDMNIILEPIGGMGLYNIAARISRNVAYFLPKNADRFQIVNGIEKPNAVGRVENKLSGISTTCTFYFGQLVEVCKRISNIEEVISKNLGYIDINNNNLKYK